MEPRNIEFSVFTHANEGTRYIGTVRAIHREEAKHKVRNGDFQRSKSFDGDVPDDFRVTFIPF